MDWIAFVVGGGNPAGGVEGANLLKSRSHAHTAFQVTTSGKSWFIKTQEEDDAEVLTNWVSAIRGAIAR